MRLTGFLKEFFKDSRLVERIDLVEVVLHEPAEMVLSPFIQRAPSEEVKRWLLTNCKNWLLKQPQNLLQLPYLPRNATEQQKKAFEYKDLYDLRLTPDVVTKIEHIMDYFTAVPNPPRLERMSVPDVFNAAELRVKQINAQAAKEFKGKKESDKNIKVVMEFPGDYKVVEMLNQAALGREGMMMGHCVGDTAQGYGAKLRKGENRFFSLRDPQNSPHCTMQIDLSGGSMTTSQIKGKGNHPPPRRYWPMLLAFLKEYGIEVDGDFSYVGLLNFGGKVMTQDEFKDLIYDPENEHGKKMISTWQNDSHYMHRQPDQMIAMFNAMYGSKDLSDGMIQSVFQTVPTHAIQVIEHYGNRFNLDQMTAAFIGLTHASAEDRQKNYNWLLRTITPTVDVCKHILARIHETNDRVSRLYGMKPDDEFIAALFQSYPEVYADLVLADKEALKRELDVVGPRSAGPFFVFVNRKMKLTTTLVEKAFQYFPEKANTVIEKNGIQLDAKLQLGALMGIVQYEKPYSRHDRTEEDKAPAFEQFLTKWKPGPGVIGAVFNKIGKIGKSYMQEDLKKSLFALLDAVQKIDPNMVDRDVRIKATIALNSPKMFRQFFEIDDDPPKKMQEYAFAQAVSNDSWKNVLRTLPKVDPSLWEKTLALLKPEKVKLTKSVGSNVPDKDKPKVKDYSGNLQYRTKWVNKDVPLDDKEKAVAYNRARHHAAEAFMSMFTVLIGNPRAEENGPARIWPGITDENAYKFREARDWFESKGKSKLFDTAVARAQREHKISTVKDTGDRYSHQLYPEQIQNFISHIKTLPAKDIAYLINDKGHEKRLFAELINHAPDRVPEVILKSKSGRKIYDELKWKGVPLDKEQTFKSLEAVWASPDINDDTKDDYTVKVFKRFKPKPDRLLAMLEQADSKEATEYVIKKTKRPAPDLVKYVFDNYPGMLGRIPLEFITDDQLREIFNYDNERLWHGLAMRDLRGYYKTDNRAKWAEADFHGKLDRESAGFARYKAAAEATGNEKEFERFAREAELEDMHGEVAQSIEHPPEPGEQYGKTTQTIDYDTLKKHLDEWSNSSLIHFADHVRGVDDYTPAILYFNHFGIERLAQLVRLNLLEVPYNYWDSENKKVRKLPLAKFNKEKLEKVMMLALNGVGEDIPIKRRRYYHENFSDNAAKALKNLMKAGFVPSEELIMAFLVNKPAHRDDELMKQMMHETDSDNIKNWFADHYPHDIDDIGKPNQYVIDLLYDKYSYVKQEKVQIDDPKGAIDPETEKVKKVSAFKYTVSYWLWSAVRKWFKQGDTFHKPRSNPEVEKMMWTAAKKRGESAEIITQAIFDHLAGLRKRAETESYISDYDQPRVKDWKKIDPALIRTTEE